jgi:hypothetical protein
MNGSGTSMMLDSLGRHPELYALPDETHMMPYIIAQQDRFGDLMIDSNFRGYWQFAIDNLPVLQKRNGGIKPEIPSNWNDYARSVEGVFNGIFSTLAAAQGKQRWCEKTPDHIQHIALLAEIFPRSRFIHMIRDGREVACSISRRQMRAPELVIYRWKKLLEMGRHAGAALGDRYTELKYEDLTRDPRGEMQKLCAFLNLDFDESVIQSRMPQSGERKRLADGELGEISENPTKWPDYFDRDSLQRLERIGGDMLASLAYPVETTAGDVDPGSVKRTYWRITDFFRLTRFRMRTNKNYDSLSKAARNMAFSYKAFRSKRH